MASFGLGLGMASFYSIQGEPTFGSGLNSGVKHRLNPVL